MNPIIDISPEDEVILRKHANKSQLFSQIYRPRKLVLRDSRGTGKTTETLANRLYEMIHLMPGAMIVLGTDSYEHLYKLIPALFTSLSKLGLKENESFWIDKFPPADVPRPIQLVQSPKGFAFFDNGFCIVFASTNYNSHLNGLSVQAIIWEEAKLLKWNAVKEMNLMKRGLQEYFGNLWCFNSLTIVTDMSDDPNHWTYQFDGEEDPELLQLIASLEYAQHKKHKELERCKNVAKAEKLKRDIDRLEEMMHFYRSKATLVIENSSIQNMHALGYDVINDFLDLPAQDVMLNVLSIKPKASTKYYYEGLSKEAHGFIAKDFNFLHNINDTTQEVDSRADTGEDQDEPLEISMDWNNNIITMVVGQVVNNELRFLQEFFSYGEQDPIETCVRKFCHYNRFRKLKAVKLWYDHTADCLNASHDRKYWERVKDAFELFEWDFTKEKYAQTTHDERFKIYKRILSGDQSAPFQLAFEVENLPNWYIAATSIRKLTRLKEKRDPKTKVSIRYDFIEKDKSSELSKKPNLNNHKAVPLEQQSHITEAGDGLVVGNWLKKVGKRKTRMSIR